MASVNKVILLGNLGKSPDMRYLPNGDAVANFSIATTENWKDKSGERQSKTEWHRIVAYGKLAEIMGEYLYKGSSVYIEGRLSTRKWQKEGVDHYITEIVADRMQMLGGKPAGGGGGNNNSVRHTSKPPHQDNAGGGFDDMEDDIPF